MSNTDWRQQYFQAMSCEGVVLNAGEGNMTVRGTVKSQSLNPTLIYWAANPATRNQSFTGSGLPYANPEQAYDRTPNSGAVKANNRQFEIKLKSPSAYYIGLGTLYIPPTLHIKVCEEGTTEGHVEHVKLGDGIPFRTLTYPAPPSDKPRIGSMFYYNCDLPIRSQEQILRDSEYGPMPKDFWGLRPAL